MAFLKDVKIDLVCQEKASRVELIIRFFYLIPLIIVLMILNIMATIGIVVNFFTSLILGKRIAALSKFVDMYIRYTTKVSAYAYLTDERPPIMPEEE